MDIIKINGFVFRAVNGGINVTLENPEQKEYRFDPSESLELCAFIDEHRAAFDQAKRPEQVASATSSSEWYNQKLNEAFDAMPD